MIGEARQEQRQSEDGKQGDCEPAAILVSLGDPAATDRGKGRDDGEGQRHAREQRQATAHERLIVARENERQHREDAWTS